MNKLTKDFKEGKLDNDLYYVLTTISKLPYKLYYSYGKFYNNEFFPIDISLIKLILAKVPTYKEYIGLINSSNQESSNNYRLELLNERIMLEIDNLNKAIIDLFEMSRIAINNYKEDLDNE